MTLFDRVTEHATLLEAFDKVEENHGCAGFDGQTIEDFALNLEGNLNQIREDLISGRFRPSPLLRVYVEKDDGGKRPLSIPTVRDRVAHTSVALVITPLLDMEFEDVSFAYREGRSVDQAVRRILALRDGGYRWVVDADIHRYFDEIPHSALLKELRQHVADQRLLRLVRRFMKADVFFAGTFHRLTKGVPQGSPLSPVLANLYLDRFDESFEKGSAKLVRFADDFVILCKTRPQAEAALSLSEEMLGQLRLRFNQNETRITHFDEGFRFLGVHFLRSLAFRPLYPSDPEPDERPLDEEEDLLSSVALAKEEDPLVEEGPHTPPAGTSMEAAFREAFPIPKLAAIKRAARQSGSKPSAETEGQDTVVEPSEPRPERAELEPTTDSDPVLRTLYLITQGSELGREDERFVVRKEDRQLAEVPALKVDQIMVFGNVGITTPAMQFCLRREIPIFLLSLRGRYYGVVDSMASQRVLLHRDQFLRHSDPEFALAIAREIVMGKVANARTLLVRYGRRRPQAGLDSAVASLKDALDKIAMVESLDQLRGLEGGAAACYFKAFASLIEKDWEFSGRKRRPPPDPINSLLSYGYTVLFQNVYSLARSRGLHPYVGFYHSLRQGHAALISDLVEEFRVSIVDSAVLSMVNRRSIRPDEFRRPSAAGSPCLMAAAALRKATRGFEAALNRSVAHPDSPGRTDYRRAILFQAERLCAAIQSGQPTYKAFLIR